MLTQEQIQKHLRKPHWTTIWIAGRDENDPGEYFAYDRESRQSIKAETSKHAAEICKSKNAGN